MVVLLLALSLPAPVSAPTRNQTMVQTENEKKTQTSTTNRGMEKITVDTVEDLLPTNATASTLLSSSPSTNSWAEKHRLVLLLVLLALKRLSDATLHDE
jgi:hypothetical protein